MTPELPLSLADVNAPFTAYPARYIHEEDSDYEEMLAVMQAEWSHRIAVALVEVDRLEQQGKAYEAIELMVRIAKSARAYDAEFTSTPSTNE